MGKAVYQRGQVELWSVVLLVIPDNTGYDVGIMGSEKTISFRAVADKIDTLDSLAAAQDRSRSYLINQAISNYIELHAYQDELVRKGLEEMRKGRVVSHQDVMKRLKRAGRGRRSPGR
jgi:predicted transcriptional regulator